MEEPKIKIAATIDSGIGEWPTRQDDKIYDTDGISPAIAVCRTNHVPNIMEEPKIMQIGSYVPNSMCAGKVVSSDDVAPAVMENHGMITAVVEPCILGYSRDNKGKIVNFHEKELANTINTYTGSGGSMEQYVKEPMIQPLIPWNRPGEPQPISPTITTSGWQDNNVVLEPLSRKDNIAYKCMPNGNIRAFDASTPDKRGISELQIVNPDNECPTITTAHEPKVLLRYRIRKLTERECFRLMDVDDSDIDKIDAHRIKVTLKDGKVKEKPIPKSAKYKLAGNSIVVSCLYHIFYQMFIAEPPEPKPIQKSLFDF